LTDKNKCSILDIPANNQADFMLLISRALPESPFQQPRGSVGHLPVFDSSRLPHTASLFPITSRVSGKTPCASAHVCQLRSATEHAFVFSRNSSLVPHTFFIPSPIFPASTTTTATLAENSRNIREKAAKNGDFSRTYFGHSLCFTLAWEQGGHDTASIAAAEGSSNNRQKHHLFPPVLCERQFPSPVVVTPSDTGNSQNCRSKSPFFAHFVRIHFQ
jgi:hypothetical protein